jgi:hypothetical protein
MIKHLIQLLLLVLSIHTGYAQSDTITVSEGTKNPADEKYDRVYKIFIQDRTKDINHLWKINLVDLGFVMPNFGFEQKLGTCWSSDSYVKLGYDMWENDEFFSNWEVSQQLKYFYTVNRRKKLGRKTNGFSGNYFSLNIYGGEKHTPKPALHSGTIIDTKLFYGVSLNYGLQRRIGNIGYFEASAGVNYQYRKISGNELVGFFGTELNQDQLTVVFKVKAGFALDSFSKQHKLLK